MLRSASFVKLLTVWSLSVVFNTAAACAAQTVQGETVFDCPSLPDVSGQFPQYIKPNLSGDFCNFRVLRHSSQLLGGPCDCHFRYFFPAPSGRTVSITAAGDGDIVCAAGRLIIVRYRSGLSVLYGKLQRTKVVTGSKVSNGDELGLLPVGFRHRPTLISLGVIRVFAE